MHVSNMGRKWDYNCMARSAKSDPLPFPSRPYFVRNVERPGPLRSTLCPRSFEVTVVALHSTFPLRKKRSTNSSRRVCIGGEEHCVWGRTFTAAS